MEDEFSTLPAPARRLLGSSTVALVLGPLWLLWHGAWRTALRCYLPLVLALPRARHWITPLAWLIGTGLLHFGAMELGGRI